MINIAGRRRHLSSHLLAAHYSGRYGRFPYRSRGIFTIFMRIMVVMIARADIHKITTNIFQILKTPNENLEWIRLKWAFGYRKKPLSCQTELFLCQGMFEALALNYFVASKT